jgi:hypothetical protein
MNVDPCGSGFESTALVQERVKLKEIGEEFCRPTVETGTYEMTGRGRSETLSIVQKQK